VPLGNPDDLNIPEDTVRAWVLNILHGGGGELDTASIKYTGNNAAFGKFWRGEVAGIGVDRGLILSTGPVMDARGNNLSGAATHKFNDYHGPPSGDSSCGECTAIGFHRLTKMLLYLSILYVMQPFLNSGINLMVKRLI